MLNKVEETKTSQEQTGRTGRCELLDVPVNYETGRPKRCVYCGGPLSQPHGQDLSGEQHDHGIPLRDQGLMIDVVTGVTSELPLCAAILTTPTRLTTSGRYRGR